MSPPSRVARRPHRAPRASLAPLAALAALGACGDLPAAPTSPLAEPSTMALAPDVLGLMEDARYRSVPALETPSVRARLAPAVVELDDALHAGQRHRSERAVQQLLAVLPPEPTGAPATAADGPRATVVPVVKTDALPVAHTSGSTVGEDGDAADVAAIRLAVDAVAAVLAQPAALVVRPAQPSLLHRPGR